MSAYRVRIYESGGRRALPDFVLVKANDFVDAESAAVNVIRAELRNTSYKPGPWRVSTVERVDP